MDPTNVNMMYHSDFLEVSPLSHEYQKPELIWWGLAITETLLFMRLILGYFDANPTSTLTDVVYTITYYIVYPFAITLTNASPEGSYGWVTMAAISGYFVLTFALVSFLKAMRSPHSRIERTRALSRRKYSL